MVGTVVVVQESCLIAALDCISDEDWESVRLCDGRGRTLIMSLTSLPEVCKGSDRYGVKLVGDQIGCVVDALGGQIG